MKIGIDARFYHPEAAGLARYTSQLVTRLLALPESQDHHFVIFMPSNASIPTSTHPHVDFVKTDIKHYSVAEQTRFASQIQKHRFDVMHFLHFNHPLRYRGPSIFTIHDLILTFYPGSGQSTVKKAAYELAMRHALKSAKTIIAVSKTTKRQLADHYGTDPHKIAVVYEGVDASYQKCNNLELIDEVLSRHKINKPYVLYVGQLRVHKNIVRLIEAFASVHAKNRSLQLVLAGKPDKHYLPEIQAAIARHHLKQNVILTGFVPEEDLPVLYSGAVCSVTPSLIEGFGLPPLESFACECPVVCSNASCLPEIAGDAALYFDPQNPVEIASALHKVISSAEIQGILVKAGLERIKHFSWDKMAKQTFALYQKYDKTTVSE